MSPPDPLLAQGVAFCAAGLTGVACGLAFDGYRAVRRVLPPRRWVGHVLDVLFVAGVTPVAAAGLLTANWGELRAYPLGGLVLGGALYLALGSPVVLPAGTAVLRGGLVAAGAVARAASWPERLAIAAVTGTAARFRAAGVALAEARARRRAARRAAPPRRPRPDRATRRRGRRA